MGLDSTRVRHRGWRNFWRVRTEANGALNALIIALRLSSHVVTQLPSGVADRALRELYAEEIPDVRHLGTKVKNAPAQMAASEVVLAAMAIPVAVTVYNDYVVEAVTLLHFNGTTSLTDPGSRMLGRSNNTSTPSAAFTSREGSSELFVL